jgi:hypothetical protein
MERRRDEETERRSGEENKRQGAAGATTCSAAKGRALVRVTIISVLLGLITTIAVAWSIAIAVPMPAISAGPLAPPPTGRGAMTPRAPANYIDSLPRVGIFEREGSRNVFMVERAPGTWAMTVLGSAGGHMADTIPSDELPNRAEADDVPSWSRLRRTADREARLWLGVYTETARGWPMLALRETHILDPMAKPPERLIGGIPIRRMAPTGMDPRSLPLIPIWRGLLLNCLIFGTAWYAILFGVPGLLRWRARKIRQIEGQCPSCGYDLEGRFDAGCPECGWGRPS